MGELAKQLDVLAHAGQRLEARKFRTLEKALRSDDPEDMIKAAQVVDRIQNKTDANNGKAFFIDPLEFNSNLGYKDKAFSLSYSTLKKMSRTPIINAILKTRKNQVADFAEPQENKYSTGFVIRKKPKMGVEQKMDNKDKKIAFAITDFVLKCGSVSTWEHDDFDTFIRKIIDDSLTFDQMTFECIRNRRGQLERVIATDAATFRIADSYFEEDYDNPFFKREGSAVWQDRADFGKKVHGYYPAYTQVYQNVKVSEFYPWELCFGIRNPTTSIWANGYGCSELEELINVVTSLLYSDEYNRRFFSQGSAPKGMLLMKGSIAESSLQQFKQQWQSMISGVMQSWKTPILQGDAEWIDLQKNNRDMEYSSWIEYLIKIACAIYSIDPTEIGWDISRSGTSGGLFEGSQEQRLKHSKDKGLYPLLKFLQRKLNKYIVEQLNPDYELVFVGLNGLTIDEELDMDIKKANSFVTVNEIREKYEMKPLDYGDVPLNPIMMQSKTGGEMGGMGMGGGFSAPGDDEGGEPEGEDAEDNPFDIYASEDDSEEDEEVDEAEKGNGGESFVKAFDNYLKQEGI